MSPMDRLFHRGQTADPSQSFGAPEAYPEPETAQRRGRGSFLQEAGARWKALRDRISGGEDASFDDPDYRPQPDIPDFDNGAEAYAPAPGYGYAPQPRESAAPVWEQNPESDFYGGYVPQSSPEPAWAPPESEEGVPYGDWQPPEDLPPQTVRPVRPQKKRRPGDLTYTFWSFGIAIGLIATVFSFIYGCVV